jgi:hypothetical protein
MSMRFLTTFTLAVAVFIEACGGGATPVAQQPGNSVGATGTTAGTSAATSPASTTPASTLPTGTTGTSGASAPSAVVPPAVTTPVAGAAAPPSAMLGVAGVSGGMPASATAGAAAQMTPPKGAVVSDCGLHTKWPGDEYCIKPPPADKGFQIHIGPTDYDNPEAKYVIQPGAETNEFFPATSGNTTDVFYFKREYRMRPGSHHLILTAGGSGFGGKRLGGSQNLARDNPENGVIPPEDQGVGMKLAANTALTVNLHYVNLTPDKPELKEAWVNIWYRDAKDVTEPAYEMYSFAPMNIPAGEHALVHGECPITQSARILSHYGHRHANNLRFSTWRKRGSQQDLIYEDYDWEEPLTLEFSSLVTNTPPNPTNKVGGGWSGPLDLMAGDTVIFECDIVNMTDHTFVGMNEAENDEMCILIGDTVGSAVTANCKYTTTKM